LFVKAGSIESIAAVLQLHQGFIFPNINCEDLNPEITSIIDVSRIPQKLIETELKLMPKPVLFWRC
jgi:3-oxoacyl-(acyl-carrier-protein) synthase